MPDGRTGWNELAAIYDATRAFPGDGERSVPRAMADRLRPLGVRRLLDLGCGTGRFALPLAREGFRVVGADNSPEMLSMLLAKRVDERLEVVRCDAARLPFRRAFDAVLFSHFLHFFESLEPLAAELRRALVPGAHVVVLDTSSGPRPASRRVLALVMPLLSEGWTPWPSGDGKSRDRELFQDLIGRLDGREIDVAPLGSFPTTVSLRDALRDVRERTWWTCRVHPEAAVVRAAKIAERKLLDEGADLDEQVDEPVVVRLLIGRTA